jgi:beta-mannosidase
MRLSSLLGCIILLLFGSQAPARTVRHLLHSNWQFADTTGKVYPAVVPGNIHTDLLHNRLIPDPFFGNNEQKLQWIGQRRWTYTTHFDVPDSVWQQPQIALCFDGLDTYATIFLNGKPLLRANNMFRNWEAGVKKQLKQKGNTIQVVFDAPQAIADSLQHTFPITLPADSRVFTRKAPYQYGWDWGPVFITCGIWKPVYLRAWGVQALNEVWVTTPVVNEKSATIQVQCTAAAKSSLGRVSAQLISPGGQILARKQVQAGPQTSWTWTIPDPQRWQPNGSGTPALYTVQISLEDAAGRTVETRRQTFGIRTAQWVQEPDSAGRSFYLRINDEPVFAKGANYIPAHSFPGVTVEGQLLQVQPSALRALPAAQLLAYCRDAHINMIRIWGGGIYESDEFYDLCDAYGIMVWQDFMFACAMYPWDAGFLDNVKAEITQQVKRLRHHPSIVLWCGNNEVDEAWHNWGWEKQYTAQQQEQIWKGYQQLFQQLIPAVVQQYDGSRQYIASSPEYGWGRPQSMVQGDSHYWGVWWGMQPVETLRTKVPRFMSEYGMQALPSVATLQSVVPPGGLDTTLTPLRNHQKHPTGFANLGGYLQKYFPAAADFETYSYHTQLLQAATLETAIVAQRMAQPYCMGTLYWQLNDCWPVISWSTVDFYGGWKAGMYRIRDLYAPLLADAERQGNDLRLRIVNDSAALNNITISIEVNDFEGHALTTWNREAGTLFKGVSSWTLNKGGNPIDWNKVYIQTRVYQQGHLLHTRVQVPAGYREVVLPASHVSYSVQGDSLVLYTNRFARNVSIQTNRTTFRTSDNYFDLPPATRKAVALFNLEPGDVIHVRSFVDRKK